MKSANDPSRFALIACAVLLSLGLVGNLRAEFNRTPLLIDAPTADAQDYGSLLFNASLTQRLSRDPAVPGGERNLSFSLSPVRRLSVAVTAYTRRDYVLGASYQLLDGGAGSLALGIHDMGIYSHVSEVGHDDDIWPDENYESRPYENFSAFLVGSVPVGSVLRLHAGLGRGRYVGYGNRSQYLNTDYLVGGRHQWAVGLFGGVEARLGRHLALALEADGRDVNAGVKANLGPVTAGVALTKIEGFLSKEQFQRVSAAVSYQANNIIGRRTALTPPVQPPAVNPGVAIRLKSVFFQLGKFNLTEEARRTLNANAKALKRAPAAKVAILGRTYELGSEQYNLKLGEARARAVYDFLVKAGIEPARLEYRSLGQANVQPGTPLWKYRRCDFEPEQLFGAR